MTFRPEDVGSEESETPGGCDTTTWRRFRCPPVDPFLTDSRSYMDDASAGSCQEVPKKGIYHLEHPILASFIWGLRNAGILPHFGRGKPECTSRPCRNLEGDE